VVRLHRGPATVIELAEPYDMSLRAVLKHVHVLEAAGLVRTMKEGRVRRCELDRSRLVEAERWMDDLRRRWERRIDRIETYIERGKKE
jgi:DNA-binding transcriptional ArsR family regulator